MDIESILSFTDALVFAQMGAHLSDLQLAMLRESWSWQRQSYDKIADTYGYSATYLKHDVGPKLWRLLSTVLGEKVNKTSFRAAIERRWQQELSSKEAASSGQPAGAESGIGAADRPRKTIVDWGDAAEVSTFYGRQPELAQLQQWVLDDRCRLLTILGMGGMGKTALAVKLTQQMIELASADAREGQQSAFEFVIWRSLRNAPAIEDLLRDLLRVLSQQADLEEMSSLDEQLTRLLNDLRQHRCLLILDNVESVLSEREPAAAGSGQGDAGYRRLFRQVGEAAHQSCLVLTSREKPSEVVLLEGDLQPVRSLALEGLELTAGQEIFKLKGAFQGDPGEWQRLIQGYSGNPLALKIIATTIQSLFGGSIADFLQQNTLVFGSIRSLIAQQFERLTDAEAAIFYWLAIYRDPATFADLRTDIFPPIAPQQLIELLESLEQRSLIERRSGGFSLQPVVMEYATEQLVQQVCLELQSAGQTPSFPLATSRLRTHALMQATAQDYIREIQTRLILQPVIDRLSTALAGAVSLVDHVVQLLYSLRHKPVLEVGYAAGNLLNLLCHHQEALRNYDFSHLAIRQAHLQQIQLRDVDFTGSAFSRSTFLETLGIVFSVAFSPVGTSLPSGMGTLLATGDAEGGLRLWQAKGELLLNFVGHAGWVWSIAFSPDGKTLASCSSDKTIRLWDAASGRCLHTLKGHSSSIWSIAFSADGQTLASGGDEPDVKLWQVKTGTAIQTLSGHTGRILAVAFSPDGRLLASGSDDCTLRLWNIQTGECEQVYQGHEDRIWSIAFSPDGQLLASGSADRTIRLWDLQTGECELLTDHEDRVRSIQFHDSGRMLISASDDQTIRIWDVLIQDCKAVLRGHRNTIFTVSVDAETQTIASGSADQTVRFWDMQTGRCLKTLKGYTNSVFSVAFSSDGQVLASGSTDQTLRLWNWQTGQPLQTLQGHEGWVTSTAFHPQGQLLASSSADQTVKLWSLQTGQCLHTLRGHSNWVQSVGFSPDGKMLASSGDDRTIRLWDIERGRCIQVLEGHEGWIWSVAFSPDGQMLASSSEDETIRLWHAQTGECLHRLTGHRGRVQSIAFSPNGQYLASGSGDETVRLWHAQTGECLHQLTGHRNNVWSVAFNAKGQLASSSLDQTVRLWDVETAAVLNTLSVLTHSVRSSISFCPTAAQILATGSHNGTLQIWDIATGQCLRTLTPDRPYQDINITRVTGITEAQKSALKALGAVEQ